MRRVASSTVKRISSGCSEEERDGSEGVSIEHDHPALELNCSGCGATLQALDPSERGFIPRAKLADYIATVEACRDHDTPEGGTETEEVVENRNEEVVENRNEELRPLVCQRCFSLKHYNTALSITLKADDYLQHLSHLKDQRALHLLMIDVIDFPGSLFPNLSSLISSSNPVFIVANKIDLLPEGGRSVRKRLETMIVNESLRLNLGGCKIAKVHFISAKTGEGVELLTDSILKYWGNRGDVYLLGCTNVGKSTLFNSLLISLCGASPGELTTTGSTVSAPSATISQWPGTTLGLLSFPIMSIGKRKRLLSQAKKRDTARIEGNKFGEWGDVSTDVGTDEFLTAHEAKKIPAGASSETEDLLVEIGLRREPSRAVGVEEVQGVPRERFRLYDTPGAINDAQVNSTNLGSKRYKQWLFRMTLQFKHRLW